MHLLKYLCVHFLVNCNHYLCVNRSLKDTNCNLYRQFLNTPTSILIHSFDYLLVFWLNCIQLSRKLSTFKSQNQQESKSLYAFKTHRHKDFSQSWPKTNNNNRNNNNNNNNNIIEDNDDCEQTNISVWGSQLRCLLLQLILFNNLMVINVLLR